MVESASSLSEEALAAIEKGALVNAVRHEGKADVGAVVGRVLAEFPDLRASSSLVAKAAQDAVRRVNSMSPKDRQALLDEKYPGSEKPAEKAGRVGLPPLRNVTKGKTGFRLPPEPSGFMTIGHAMAFTINALYAQETGGALWLRFEDTNPRKVALRYYDSFRSGIKWLGIVCDHEKNVSDDMELMYERGRTLVESGKAYACSCDAEKVKRLRFEGKPCEHRDAPPERGLSVWDGLVSKKYKEGEFVIRFKGDMQNVNYSLRDTNLFRVIDHEHPLTKDRYSLWPTYDIANAIEDEVCGITHVLRSSEFRNELQELIRDALGLRQPEVIQFSRFNFKGTPVSKRLLRPLVEQKLVSGWDDPRMPTVAGLRRRGIVPEAVREFTLQVGYTKTEHEYDWSMLTSVNRKTLDPVSRRLFFVPGPEEVRVEGAPERTATIPYHPQRDLGSRSIHTAGTFFLPRADLEKLEKGSIVRLMDLYNVKVSSAGGKFTAEYAGDELIAETRKVQWVTGAHSSVKVLVPGLLFDEGGAFREDSMRVVEGLAEEAASSLQQGDIVQFPRFGFCRLDSPDTFIQSG